MKEEKEGGREAEIVLDKAGKSHICTFAANLVN